MASQESILSNLIYRVVTNLFTNEPPQRTEPCLECKEEIINLFALFPCGHAFHIRCCRKASIRTEKCPECQDYINEQLGFNEMSREQKLLAFVREM